MDFFPKILAQSLNIPDEQVIIAEPQSSPVLFDLTELFEIVFYSLNYFALAGSVFFSIVFLIDFFNSRVFNSGGELAVEKVGVSGIKSALNLWYRYYLVLIFVLLYSLFRENFMALPVAFFGVLAIFYKIWQDILDLMEIIGYFSWASNIAETIKSSLQFKK